MSSFLEGRGAEDLWVQENTEEIDACTYIFSNKCCHIALLRDKLISQSNCFRVHNGLKEERTHMKSVPSAIIPTCTDAYVRTCMYKMS